MKTKQTTRLQILREEQGITKAELARRAVMQASTIGLIEAGRLIPYESQLNKIAQALGYEEDPQKLMEVIL